MKTTIDLPDSLLERAKSAAAERGITLKQLLVQGLEMVLRSASRREAALSRLQKGLRLGRKHLDREAAHAR